MEIDAWSKCHMTLCTLRMQESIVFNLPVLKSELFLTLLPLDLQQEESAAAAAAAEANKSAEGGATGGGEQPAEGERGMTLAQRMLRKMGWKEGEDSPRQHHFYPCCLPVQNPAA
jgi:hypothetical protein